MNGKKIFVRPEDVAPYSPGGHSGTINRRLIGLDSVGAQNYEVVLGEIHKGGGAHPHSHADLEHGYYILEGRCLMAVGDEKQEVGPGTAVFVPKGYEHEITVLSDEPLKLLVFYAPPQFAGQ